MSRRAFNVVAALVIIVVVAYVGVLAWSTVAGRITADDFVRHLTPLSTALVGYFVRAIQQVLE
jgi:hypothetical protein